MKIDTKNINALAIPVLILVAIIVLIIISAKILFDKVSSLNSQLSESKKTETMLQDKLVSLQTLSKNITSNSDTVLLALPVDDSVLTAISQLRSQAQNSNVLITSISSGSSSSVGDTTFTSNAIDFELEGTYQDIFTFAKKIKNSLPINRFDIVKLDPSILSSATNYTFKGTMITYSAALPVTIPAITEPVVELTADENTILSKLATFEKPTFTQGDITNATATGKANPFQ